MTKTIKTWRVRSRDEAFAYLNSIDWKETDIVDMADISKAWCASWWKGIAYHPSGEPKRVKQVQNGTE